MANKSNRVYWDIQCFGFLFSVLNFCIFSSFFFILKNIDAFKLPVLSEYEGEENAYKINLTDETTRNKKKDSLTANIFSNVNQFDRVAVETNVCESNFELDIPLGYIEK